MSMTPLVPTRAGRAATIAGVALLAYAAGVAGPFILDDHVNLLPVWLWWAGQRELEGIFSNPSGPAGRPLAMLSFAANALAGGQHPFGYKLVNLLLHLGNAGLLWYLLRRMASISVPAWPTWLAGTVAILWLLHPQHVSTVLYVVQRMALLGATAQLAAVLVFVIARSRVASDPRAARWLLFAAFPATVLAGLLAKETAALAPLLCGVLELTCFARHAPARLVRVFFALVLWLPLAVGIGWILLHPDLVMAGYAGREFSLVERLYSQPRALMEHAVNIAWPAGLALYRDGFVVSHGLWDPPATLLALVALVALGFAALFTRVRLPLFALGIGWFLAGHALEAGPFALELHFEHRNYLPSVGLILALLALLTPWLARLRAPRRVGGLAALAVILATLTAVRSHSWGDLDRLLAREAPPAPELSRRLQVDRAIRAFERGDPVAQEEALSALESGPAGHRAAAVLWRAIFACDNDAMEPSHIAALEAAPVPRPTHNHYSWLGILGRRAREGRCRGFQVGDFDAVLTAWQRAAEPTPHAAHQFELLRRATIQVPVR
jgi:hypothetical protein